jgi:hypothetical protein
MRKIAIVAVALCVVVIVLALLPQFLDVNHFRPRIQTELQNRLGRPVSLGNIKASFLPPSLIVRDVEIGEDLRFAPDAQQIARMKLQNLLPSFGNPGGMTSGVLGAVLGGNKKGGQQQKPGGLGGILGALVGQQKTNPQQPAAADNPKQDQQQAQPANPLGDLLNSVMKGKKEKPQRSTANVSM